MNPLQVGYAITDKGNLAVSVQYRLIQTQLDARKQL